MRIEIYGRDATCPAEKRYGPAQENTSRAGAGTSRSRTGTGSGGLLAMRQALCRIPPVHAGRLFLAGMQPGLPVRIVKKIDLFAMKVLKGGLRRYCL